MGKYVDIDVKKATKEQIAAGLKMLESRLDYKEKVKRGELKGHTWKDMTPEKKEQAKLRNKERSARIALLAKKAIEAGLTVTEEEVQAKMQATSRS